MPPHRRLRPIIFGPHFAKHVFHFSFLSGRQRSSSFCCLEINDPDDVEPRVLTSLDGVITCASGSARGRATSCAAAWPSRAVSARAPPVCGGTINCALRQCFKVAFLIGCCPSTNRGISLPWKLCDSCWFFINDMSWRRRATMDGRTGGGGGVSSECPASATMSG